MDALLKHKLNTRCPDDLLVSGSVIELNAKLKILEWLQIVRHEKL